MSNLSFTYKWQAQPYVPWKGASTNSAVPTYSQPLQKNETQQNGPSFSARPIKHWRKQLNPRPGSGRGRPGVGMPMDVPGGSVYLGSDSSNCVVCGEDGLSNSTGLKNNILRDNGQKAATFMLSPKYNASANILEGVGNNKENVCVACNPENNRIRSAIQDTGYLGRYHYTSQSYLRARGNLYNQKSTTNADISGVQYIDPATGLEYWPTNNKSGIAPQIRGTQYCLSQAVVGDLANGTWDPSTRYCRADTTIYKPNNRQFATQGAVSSSSRILRLQYNTITKNGNSFRTAWGNQGANAGKYRGTPTAPYFLKSKNQARIPNIRNRIPGNHTFCFYTPTGSLGQVAYAGQSNLPSGCFTENVTY